MKILKEYFDIQKQLYEYFGYVEDWVVIPIDDVTECYWYNDERTVYFATTEEELKSQTGNYYENEIYTQRHLPKWVYKGKDYTMICVDTHTDGNKFLQIFNNKKNRTETN